ncbi:hypothetical protein FB45DRAFT_90471 [Roridomyces roridus]|uniref:Uncharacterized protein n=1 Tax=Roridomyces roridus TaxID=1738132 RepID=A0AAD7F5X0_9AGAR|nr:hypothetical protein FB45DRAFT_90471 [Roridomyces roridus]
MTTMPPSAGPPESKQRSFAQQSAMPPCIFLARIVRKPPVSSPTQPTSRSGVAAREGHMTLRDTRAAVIALFLFFMTRCQLVPQKALALWLATPLETREISARSCMQRLRRERKAIPKAADCPSGNVPTRENPIDSVRHLSFTTTMSYNDDEPCYCFTST